MRGEATDGTTASQGAEYVYVSSRSRTAWMLRNGLRAIGFGVGHDPIPAVLAAQGLSVLATDRDAAEGDPVDAGCDRSAPLEPASHLDARRSFPPTSWSEQVTKSGTST